MLPQFARRWHGRRCVLYRSNLEQQQSADATSQPAASGPSAHDCQCDPWTHDRARHYLSQGSQRLQQLVRSLRTRRMSACRQRALSLQTLVAPICTPCRPIRAIEKHITMPIAPSCEETARGNPWHRAILSTAFVAPMTDWKAFSSGRNFAAWIGLVPKQHSTGGKERLGGISKQGNRYLRWLLVAGAISIVSTARMARQCRWVIEHLERRPTKVAAVALANKIARMAWAMMVSVTYRAATAQATPRSLQQPRLALGIKLRRDV